MNKLIQSIEKSLTNQNRYWALVLSLILPDICWKSENNNESSTQRYVNRFNEYLGEKYNWFLSWKDCYALRCSFLHEGSNQITSQRIRELLDYIIFIPNWSHKIKISNWYSWDSKYDGKEVLYLSVFHFCQDIIQATKQRSKNNINQSEILQIHEDGWPINGIFIQ